MTLINCKAKFKLQWRKSFPLSVAVNDNDSATLDKIMFTIKDKELYVPVVALSAKVRKKLLKSLE